MNLYLAIKLLHILSATILFGTGLGTAFFMYQAYRSGNIEAMRVTTSHVVMADWFFTTPAIVVQLLTGLWLTLHLGISVASAWFMIVIGLFALIGACWLPVVWIQIKVRNMLRDSATVSEIRKLMTAWVLLGIPAFLCVIVLFSLMVYKPWMNWLIIS